jgi:ligand-binding SRPBCC domain-containing protein
VGSRPSIYARSIEIAAPAERLYRFHLDTRNAPLISPDGATFVAIAGRFPVEEGARVTLRVRQRPLPLAQTWVVRIDRLVEDRLVVDVAERSPFAEWRHEHRFAALGGGHTLMSDVVTYRLPGGPLGRLADRLAVRRWLDRMFEIRHAKTKRLMEEAPSGP